MRPRFWTAMACYGVLAILAGVTLDDLKIRAAVWFVLGALAVKTWIALARQDE